MSPDRHRLINTLRDLVWSTDDRRELQQHGLNLVPANFYSSVPSLEEVEQSFEYNSDAPPYLDDRIFDAALMQDTLRSLISHASEFSPDEEGDEATCANGFFWKNSQFSFSDAMSYFAFLRKLKPARVVEIGSGFSTLIAADALKRNGAGEIICIEPYPRPFLPALPNVTLKQLKAQDLKAEELDGMLQDGDVLFIDSTHTVKSGSDCLHIYLRLLPRLTKSVYVHIHDIFLPFGMPQEWLRDLQIYWTEQYLVHAWLQENARAKVIYGSAYHSHFNADLLKDFMHGRSQAGGSSLWLKYQPRADQVSND
jgi:predicted O-methyltransferase YrrM